MANGKIGRPITWHPEPGDVFVHSNRVGDVRANYYQLIAPRGRGRWDVRCIRGWWAGYVYFNEPLINDFVHASDVDAEDPNGQ